MSIWDIDDDSLMLKCTVTITLVDLDNGNPIQESVTLIKNKNATLKDLAYDAVDAFNDAFTEKGIKYRLDTEASNYRVIASPCNELKEYTDENVLSDFSVLDFAFEYSLENVKESRKENALECVMCICF